MAGYRFWPGDKDNPSSVGGLLWTFEGIELSAAPFRRSCRRATALLSSKSSKTFLSFPQKEKISHTDLKNPALTTLAQVSHAQRRGGWGQSCLCPPRHPQPVASHLREFVAERVVIKIHDTDLRSFSSSSQGTWEKKHVAIFCLRKIHNWRC